MKRVIKTIYIHGTDKTCKSIYIYFVCAKIQACYHS